MQWCRFSRACAHLTGTNRLEGCVRRCPRIWTLQKFHCCCSLVPSLCGSGTVSRCGSGSQEAVCRFEPCESIKTVHLIIAMAMDSQDCSLIFSPMISRWKGTSVVSLQSYLNLWLCSDYNSCSCSSKHIHAIWQDDIIVYICSLVQSGYLLNSCKKNVHVKIKVFQNLSPRFSHQMSNSFFGAPVARGPYCQRL